MPRTRRTFTDEFKREAVKLVKQPGAMVTHIAKDLGIEQSVLRRWVSKEHGGVMDMRANKHPCDASLLIPSDKCVKCSEDPNQRHSSFSFVSTRINETRGSFQLRY